MCIYMYVIILTILLYILQDDMFYQLIDADGQALQYFFIEEKTGIIKLKKSLEESSFTSFSVSTHV